jgi:hypothetical protein
MRIGWVRWLLSASGVLLCVLVMVLSWAAMLKASQELVDPWDMARRFAPPSGTLAHTVRTTLQVLAPVIVITLMLLSVILLIRALRLTHGHPAISMAFLLTHAGVIGLYAATERKRSLSPFFTR